MYADDEKRVHVGLINAERFAILEHNSNWYYSYMRLWSIRISCGWCRCRSCCRCPCLLSPTAGMSIRNLSSNRLSMMNNAFASQNLCVVPHRICSALCGCGPKGRATWMTLHKKWRFSWPIVSGPRCSVTSWFLSFRSSSCFRWFRGRGFRRVRIRIPLKVRWLSHLATRSTSLTGNDCHFWASFHSRRPLSRCFPLCDGSWPDGPSRPWSRQQFHWVDRNVPIF